MNPQHNTSDSSEMLLSGSEFNRNAMLQKELQQWKEEINDFVQQVTGELTHIGRLVSNESPPQDFAGEPELNTPTFTPPLETGDATLDFGDPSPAVSEEMGLGDEVDDSANDRLSSLRRKLADIGVHGNGDAESANP